MMRPKPERPNNMQRLAASSPRQRNRVPSPSIMTPQARRMVIPPAAASPGFGANSYNNSNAAVNSMNCINSMNNSELPTTPMRYINVRVAVPADYDETSSQPLVLQPSPSSPNAVNGNSQGGFSPIRSINSYISNPNSNSGSSSRRSPSISPFAFVPIGEDTPMMPCDTGDTTNYTSCGSPINKSYYKSNAAVSACSSPMSWGGSSSNNSLTSMSSFATEAYYSPTFERRGTPTHLATTTKVQQKQQQQQQPPYPLPLAPPLYSPSHTVETCSVISSDGSSTVPPPPLYQRAQSSVTVTGIAGAPAVPPPAKARRSETLRRSQKSPTTRPHSAPTLGGSVASGGGVDDTTRKSRCKTELCMHYINQRSCPFGSNCTYAHGEEELQMTKLADLHDAGLVDMATYRIKPCLTWIASGSCPFGKRCTGVHDHRVMAKVDGNDGSGSSLSWLPHTETQGNTIATDINVDGLHQKRLHTILYDNPFGLQFNLTARGDDTPAGTFTDLYNLVCNSSSNSGSGHNALWIEPGSSGCGGGSRNGKRGGRNNAAAVVHPMYKLQIALKLRGTDSDWQYKYRPQHIVHGELCMVLQKRAFVVTSATATSSGGGSGSSRRRGKKSAIATASSDYATEIALSDYSRRKSNHVLVHELAFGPDCDPSVRGVALWFNIDESEVTVCTPQQAKRFRWKTSVKKSPSASSNCSTAGTPSSSNDNNTKRDCGSDKVKPSVFDSKAVDGFPMIRPHDDAAFRLATDMMKHRLAMLKRELMSGMKERFDAQKSLENQKMLLEERFGNLQRDWITWSWPVNVDREPVDRSTPVPNVEGPYLLEDPQEKDNTENADPDALDAKVCRGANVRPIWDSFVKTASIENDNSSDESFVLKPEARAFVQKGTDTKRLPVFEALADGKTAEKSGVHLKRLAVFKELAQGKPINTCRALPHITKHKSFFWDRNVQSEKPGNPSRQQERCWKALLLQSDSSHEKRNEWDIVREHFENSRSKKVLNILQAAQ